MKLILLFFLVQLGLASRVCFIQSGDERCEGFVARPSHLVFYDLKHQNCFVEDSFTSQSECERLVPKFDFLFVNEKQLQQVKVGLNEYSKTDWVVYKIEKNQGQKSIEGERFVVPQLNCSTNNITSCVPSIRVKTDLAVVLSFLGVIYYLIWIIVFVG
jgi:hypothetical protein